MLYENSLAICAGDIHNILGIPITSQPFSCSLLYIVCESMCENLCAI